MFSFSWGREQKIIEKHWINAMVSPWDDDDDDVIIYMDVSFTYKAKLKCFSCPKFLM